MRKYVFSQGKVWVEEGRYRPIIRKPTSPTQNVVLLFVPFPDHSNRSTSGKEREPLTNKK
jgi:hypothetical protein